MKKTWLLIIATLFCLAALYGCTPEAAETQTASCRVQCVTEDGLIVWIEHTGYVYVKNVSTGLDIQTLDTVVMEFSESDLEAADGTFLNFDGNELRYSYILEKPSSIRLADPSSGEPTFG